MSSVVTAVMEAAVAAVPYDFCCIEDIVIRLESIDAVSSKMMGVESARRAVRKRQKVVEVGDEKA